FASIRTLIVETVEKLGVPEGEEDESPYTRITVEPPRDPAHGDLATNAAMVLARAAGTQPRELAGRIAEALRGREMFTDISIAGPGFINLRLSPGFWQRHLETILEAGTDYGRSRILSGQKFNVEYVSANPTGPMHVGHCRGAAVGDVIANLVAFAGGEVVKEYYINDAGAQIDVLARSVWLRYLEALGDEIGEIPSGLYPGDYLVPVGRALAGEFGNSLRSMPEAE